MVGEVQPIEPGGQLGQYSIVRELGEGACAKVYTARVDGPMGFQKDVALKVVHQHLVRAQPDIVHSLVNEARIGGLLSHPNVVQIHRFEEIGGQHVLVMEYVEGPTFSSLVRALTHRETQLPPGIVAEVGAQVCRALQYAIERVGPDGEQLNLVHRDIKPDNLILAPGGLVKVLDFGIARSTANLFLTTTLNLTRGTPCYMSPEQLRGEKLDGRSDLFALGCVLYELLLGEVLFQEAGFKLVQMVLEGDLSEHFGKMHDRSPALAQVIAGLLERPLKRRIPNALQAEKALAEIARNDYISPDLAEVSRLCAAKQLPVWETAPRVTQPLPEPTPGPPPAPPSGKAGSWFDRLKIWLGI